MSSNNTNNGTKTNKFKNSLKQKPIAAAIALAIVIGAIFSIVYVFEPNAFQNDGKPEMEQGEKNTEGESKPQSSSEVSFYPYLVDSFSATQKGDKLLLGLITELNNKKNGGSDIAATSIPEEFDRKQLGVSDNSIGFAYAWFAPDQSDTLGHGSSTNTQGSDISVGHYKGYAVAVFDSEKLDEINENSNLDAIERIEHANAQNKTSWNTYFAKSLMIPHGKDQYGFDFCLSLQDPPRNHFHSDYDFPEDGKPKKVLTSHKKNGSIIAKNPPFLDPYATQDSFTVAMSFEILPEYENCHGELGGLVLDETNSKIGWDLFEFYTKEQN